MNGKADISLLDREPRFDDVALSLLSMPKLPKAAIRETREALARARDFNERVVRPQALELDMKKHEEPDYLPWEFVREANRWGLYTMFIPRLFGGRGINFPALSYMLEEIGSACTGMSNLVGVHYLGVATLCAPFNLRVMNTVMREVVEGERTGEPCLISLAITEPEAGTDVEELELVSRGKVSCHARKVQGGYVLNGTKIFISNGHLSTWHMVIAYEDLEKPEDTMVLVAVRNGSEGFSFGRQERKMGQKGCPASELVFSDCFVPDDLVCFSASQCVGYTRTVSKTSMQLIDYVLAASRAGVSGFGTGVARGAYEEALRFAVETEVDGRPLIDQEWVQSILAEMYKNVALARLSYIESNYANGLHGLFKVLQWKPLFYLLKYMPQPVIDRFMVPITNTDFATRVFRKAYFDLQKESEQQIASAWGSLAKFAGTDAGARNCEMALELMGQAGTRHDRGLEKHLRDSKLLQIYEGTNQLNRMNLFKNMIARHTGAKVFEE